MASAGKGAVRPVFQDKPVIRVERELQEPRQQQSELEGQMKSSHQQSTQEPGQARVKAVSRERRQLTNEGEARVTVSSLNVKFGKE